MKPILHLSKCSLKRRWKGKITHRSKLVRMEEFTIDCEALNDREAFDDCQDKNTSKCEAKNESDCEAENESDCQNVNENIWEDENEIDCQYENESNWQDDSENDHQNGYEGLNENVAEEIELKSIAFIKEWSSEFNIPRTAVSKLLQFLKPNGFPYLPMDSRTLFDTPKKREVIEISPGHYSHIGVKRALDYFLSGYPDSTVLEEIQLDFNIDGVPTAKTGKGSFWLILGRVVNCNKNFIFVVGVYFGYHKPACFNDYLKPFVSEMKILLNKFSYNNKETKIKIRSFICDTPARCYVKGSKLFNGYHGCGNCCQEGDYIGRVIFLENNASLRTDETYRKRLDAEHHNYDSVIEELPIDMIRQFPLDYLHLICLGVVKKLIMMWLKGDTSSLLQSSVVTKIDERLCSYSKSQPKEFQRKLRPLSDASDYKGTEFRTFLLYSGPVALKNMLSPEKYNHFLLLHVAILILVHPTHYKTYANIAQKLLEQFVTNFSEIYGPHNIVFNVHNLVHIVDDTNTYGNLDNFSAFGFESYMFKIKRMLHKRNDSLAQLSNRIIELYNMPYKDTNPSTQ